MKKYPLRKCKKILMAVYHLLRKKKKKLLPAQVSEIKNDLRLLQENILNKNVDGANLQSRKCLSYADGILKKGNFEQIRGVVFALVFALAVALLIRQVWFELYEIPTDSMRPAFKEKDRLIVTKSKFGINFPFSTKHLLFEPHLVNRSGIIVFTVENLDVHDPDTLYFWIFPGKKQYVKRMMGKPGDTVYFYGGQMYGVDKNGRDITPLLQPDILKEINHVPIIRFDGSISTMEPFKSSMGNAFRMSIIHQMGEAVARLSVLGNQRLEGELLYTPQIHNKDTPMPSNYYELWGIGNYGIARVVQKDDVRDFANMQEKELEDAVLYLEIKHHPDLKNLELGKDIYGRIRPQFSLSSSILPLDEERLKALFANLYTARFVVKNGYAMAYRYKGHSNIGTHMLPKLEGVPDGTYEFFDGQAYQIKFGGYAHKLKEGHPLTVFSPELVKNLFNHGMDFDKRAVFGPRFDTSRFAFFKKGELYLLNNPIFKKGDKTIDAFILDEKRRSQDSNPQNPYIGFLDEGPPDTHKIRQYGLRIPENMYLALGDNYAGSGDSREFGFVPAGNLRGSPSILYWPPGSRVGFPLQPSTSWFTLPNMIVWALGLSSLGAWFFVHKRHRRMPLKDLEE